MQDEIIISEADQRWRQELAKEVARETRLPIPRVLLLEWNQLTGNKIQTRSREAELGSMTAKAIDRLPRTGRYIFSASPFPPIIPDEYLEPAREWLETRAIEAETKRRRRFKITICRV